MVNNVKENMLPSRKFSVRFENKDTFCVRHVYAENPLSAVIEFVKLVASEGHESSHVSETATEIHCTEMEK